MATFVTIGYGDQAGYERTDPAVLEKAHRGDAELVSNGAIVGPASPPVQVRNHDGNRRTVQEGPFLRSELPVAGFAIIEADDMDAAIAMIEGSPCAVAGGVVEVWPLAELPHA